MTGGGHGWWATVSFRSDGWTPGTAVDNTGMGAAGDLELLSGHAAALVPHGGLRPWVGLTPILQDPYRTGVERGRTVPDAPVVCAAQHKNSGADHVRATWTGTVTSGQCGQPRPRG